MRRAAVLCLLILPALLLAMACGDKHVLEPDYHFSMNLIKVPYWFPDPKQQLTVPQTEVIERFGRPDFIRIWWKKDGAPISTSDLSGREANDVVQDMAHADKSWIFLIDNREVTFPSNNASYRVQPLTDIMKLMATYGDPSSKSVPVMQDGQRVEEWTWIEHGITVRIIDGKEVGRQFFQGTSTGTWVGK